jgi:penicillin-binding protein 2
MSDNSRVRVSIVGVVIVALFSSLLVRLWFLQMGPEQKLRAQAIALATRKIQTESPRGRILDRNGKVLARDRAAWAVTLDRDLKTRTREHVLGQLSELIGVEPKDLRDNYQSARQSPLRPAIIAIDIAREKRLEILEHQDDYPGVHVVLLTVREYPIGGELKQPALAAQVLGYVGEIDSAQLKTLKRKGYQAGDLLGRDGVEAAYENVLRGKPKVESVQIDPRGEQIGPGRVIQEGSVGNDVYLTVDSGLQLRAEQALADGIMQARQHQNENPEVTARGYENLKAPGGAVIVLDTNDGSVGAMASYPAFDPASWIGGIRQDQFDWVNDPANAFPLVNRATQGQYAPGSTFKLVSALAMNRHGVRPFGEYYVDEGETFIGNQWFYNDKSVSNGSIELSQALTVSSDTYFYTAGDEFWHAWRNGQAAGLGMQREARALGFESKTGIEIDEATGRIPDPEWKQDFANSYYKTDEEKRDNGTWYPGDEVSLAVGQKDVLVTPLQLATAYAAFANRGALLTPHVGLAVKDASGAVVRDIAPKPRGMVPVDPNLHAVMLNGFKNVVQSEDPLGTAYWAFNGFDQNTVQPGGIAGKTGSAQVAGKGPTSWFVSFFPADAPRYVVLAVVEEGGYGAEIAAPIVRQVIEYLVNPNVPPTPIPDLSDRVRD